MFLERFFTGRLRSYFRPDRRNEPGSVVLVLRNPGKQSIQIVRFRDLRWPGRSRKSLTAVPLTSDRRVTMEYAAGLLEGKFTLYIPPEAEVPVRISGIEPNTRTLIVFK